MQSTVNLSNEINVFVDIGANFPNSIIFEAIILSQSSILKSSITFKDSGKVIVFSSEYNGNIFEIT